MNEITMKSGTRDEIISYLRGKIKGIFDVNKGQLPPLDRSDNLYEASHHTIEQQIDEFIQSGSPVVSVSLWGNKGSGTYSEQFYVTDYGNVRTDMEMKRLDDPEIRNRRIDAIKMVMKMDLDAEERWDRILKIVDEFRGKSLTAFV